LDFIAEGLGQTQGLSRFEDSDVPEVKISPALLSDNEGYRPGEKAGLLDQLDKALIGTQPAAGQPADPPTWPAGTRQTHHSEEDEEAHR